MNKNQKKLLIIFSVVIILMLLFPPWHMQSGYAQKRQESGHIWKSMSKDERHFYLGGLQEGAFALIDISFLLNGRAQSSDPSKQIILKKLALSESQRELLSDLIDRHLKEISFELFGTNATADVMTNIYNDPANNFISFGDTARIAVMKLKGKSDEDIIRKLQFLRQFAVEFINKP